MAVSLLSSLLAFVATFIVLRQLLRHRIARVIVDQPNERSLHQAPLPRIGGIALMAGVAIGWGVLGAANWVLVLAVLVLIVLSLLDDWRGLPVAVRFSVQGVVAAAYLWVEGPPLSAWLPLLGAWLAVVWMTNLYNFMDGSDGLAGGMTLFGFGAYALAAWFGGAQSLALLSACVAAAAAAFLIFNFHPAKVFMGDAGSIPLGFVAAALGLSGVLQGVWPGWFPALVFAPFVVDATVTLFKRLLRGERIWHAHRSHYYQRLVQMGWGHRGTALLEYGLMALTGACAIWVLRQALHVQAIMLVVTGVVYLILMLWVDRCWASHGSRELGGKPCE